MFKTLLKSKILLSVILVSFIIIGFLFFYIPKVTEQNTIDTVVRNSKTSVEQIKLIRAYYVNNILEDLKKSAPNIKFDYQHHEIDGKLPFPTSVIHDLSKIFSDNTGVKFQLYSKYPFKPKQDRVLNSHQIEALSFVQKDQEGIWVKRDKINNKEVLRVVVADYMTEQACVQCHNTHKDKTWDEGYWKLGDKRGVLEVITPLEEDLNANKMMRNKILIFIGGGLSLLVIYYSFMLIKRENELLSANDILDSKIKQEIKKNIQKQNQLITQSRTSAMGEMMAAIIHQWKQPLNSISLSNSSISLHLKIDDFDKNLLKKQTNNVKDQIIYMNNTLNDFRNFFKIQDKSQFKLEDQIDDVLRLIGKIYEIEKVNIETYYESDSYISGYPNEFSQVLINILNNSRDEIIAKQAKINKILIKTISSKKYVILTITDYAGGIPKNLLKKIFDPYFTTKENNKGTGIGLYMSKSILEKIDATIKAKNIKQKIDGKLYTGAQFIIVIPKVKI